MSVLARRVQSFLKGNTFLGGLPDEAIASLVGRGHIAKFSRNQCLCRRGETGETLMIILSGLIKISNVNDEAREVIFNFLGPGEVNGEIAVLDGRERTADATAMEDSEVFVVYRRDLLPVLIAHPEAMLEIVQTLCDRVRTTSGIIEDSALEMKGRMAKALLRLSQQHGRVANDGGRDVGWHQSRKGEAVQQAASPTSAGRRSSVPDRWHGAQPAGRCP